jgi:hypothetical protein
VGVMAESSQNPTISKNRRLISALRKRSFVQQNGSRLERLTISCCATRLPNPFEWQQVYATGLSVRFGVIVDSSRNPTLRTLRSGAGSLSQPVSLGGFGSGLAEQGVTTRFVQNCTLSGIASQFSGDFGGRRISGVFRLQKPLHNSCQRQSSFERLSGCKSCDGPNKERDRWEGNWRARSPS